MDQSNSGTWYTKHFGPIDMDKSHNYHIVLGIGYLVSSNEGSIVTKKEESERIFMWKIHKFCIYTRRSSQNLPKCWLISLVNLPLCLFSLRRPISPSPISTCHTPPPNGGHLPQFACQEASHTLHIGATVGMWVGWEVSYPKKPRIWSYLKSTWFLSALFE